MGVCTDAEVIKAKGPTVYTQEERGAMIRECKWVDEVIVGTPYTPTVETLDLYNCQYYAHGDDVAINEKGEDACGPMKASGRYREFKRTRGVSTTNIVGKLLLNLSYKHQERDEESHHHKLGEPIQTSKLKEKYYEIKDAEQ